MPAQQGSETLESPHTNTRELNMAGSWQQPGWPDSVFQPESLTNAVLRYFRDKQTDCNAVRWRSLTVLALRTESGRRATICWKYACGYVKLPVEPTRKDNRRLLMIVEPRSRWSNPSLGQNSRYHSWNIPFPTSSPTPGTNRTLFPRSHEKVL